MENQILELHCHNCNLVIVAKDNANDQYLLSLFEKHLIDFHAAEEFKFDVETMGKN